MGKSPYVVLCRVILECIPLGALILKNLKVMKTNSNPNKEKNIQIIENSKYSREYVSNYTWKE